jgi:DNA repair protein RecO
MADFVPEQQPDAALFDTLRLALERLDEVSLVPDDIHLAGLWFETQFLSLLGYSPTLGRCIVCAARIVVPPEEGERRIDFSPTLGGTLCAACAAQDAQRLCLAASALRGLHRLERVPHPPAAAQMELTTAARRDLRQALRALLFAHLEIRPRSQKFLDEIVAELGTGATT